MVEVQLESSVKELEYTFRQSISDIENHKSILSKQLEELRKSILLLARNGDLELQERLEGSK